MTLYDKHSLDAFLGKAVMRIYISHQQIFVCRLKVAVKLLRLLGTGTKQYLM